MPPWKSLDVGTKGVYTPNMPMTPSHLSQCADCACLNLRKAARAMTQLYEKMMQPTGLRGTQFSLLVGLAAAGPATLTHLAKSYVTDRTTLSRNLRPLAKQGLVQITTGRDRRERVVALTPKGHEAVTRAFPLWRKAQERVIQELGEARWRRLREDLSEIVRIAQAT